MSQIHVLGNLTLKAASQLFITGGYICSIKDSIPARSVQDR